MRGRFRFQWGMFALLVSPVLHSAPFVGSETSMRALQDAKGLYPIVLHLEGKFDLSKIKKSYKTHSDRTQAVAQQMAAFHKDAAKDILTLLETKDESDYEDLRHLWITNSLKFRASRALIRELRSVNSGIERIQLDEPREINEVFDAVESTEDKTDSSSKRSWAIEKVNANKVWAKENSGNGVLVAVIDSGINIQHSDLKHAIYQNPGESGKDSEGKDRATNGIDDDGNGYIDDVHGWDFEENDNDITDIFGHGSNVAGVIAGNGKSGVQTGIAPGAKILGIRACCGARTKIFETNLWEAFQYVILSKVQIISMSLSSKPMANPSYAKWRQAGEALLAAGVLHINSAGNLGARTPSKNIGAPPSNPPAWFHPDQKITGTPTSMIAVGATDQNDEVRYYSGAGPVSWEGISQYKDFPLSDDMGLTKPEVCGPSEIPTTAMFGNGYSKSFGGTSSATPAVAGVAALLLSARPDLTVAQATETLMMSAQPIGSNFNNSCGAGRVDAAAAIRYANTFFKKS